MSDETTRAAAERRRELSWNTDRLCWESSYDPDEVVDPHEVCNINDTLALAYLSEHPSDDAELIDARWIKDHCPVSTFGNLGTHGDLGPFQLWASGTGGNELRCHTFTKSNATRGDVRRLCAALGLPLEKDA